MPRDHAPVVWQKFDAQQARARCYPGRASLADLIIAPFSWPSGSALKSAAEEAGFRDIRLLTRSHPMVLEGGVEQAVQTFAGTPVAPGVAELPQEMQTALFVRMRQELTKLLKDGRVVADWTSNIIVGHA
jgi:hypothetical protein